MYNTQISIIIPIFNSEEYLEECIQSLIHQTFIDYEIICINDGSTDHSLEILEKYKQEYSKIKIFNKENEGPGSARNYGLKQAKGKYILFLDSDDWLEKDSLEKLHNIAQQNQSELVLFNAIEHYKNNRTNERIYHIIKEDQNFDNYSFDYNNNINLVMNGYHIVCTKLHKLEFIMDHSLQFADKNHFEDVLFHIKSMIYAKRISYNPEILYHYRRTNEDSRQNNTIASQKSLEFFDIFGDVKNFLEEENLYEKFRINYCKFVINETKNIGQNIDNKYFDEFLTKAKEVFIELNLQKKDYKRLPLDYRYFYKSIIESENVNDFKNKQLINKKRLYFSNKVLEFKQKIKKIF